MGIRSHLKTGMFFSLEAPSYQVLEEKYELTDSDYQIPQNLIDEFKTWPKEKQMAFLGPQYFEKGLEEINKSLYKFFQSIYVCDDSHGYLFSTPFQESLEIYDSNFVHQNYNLEFYSFPVKHLPHYILKEPEESKLQLFKAPPNLKCDGYIYYSMDMEFYHFMLRIFDLPTDILSQASPHVVMTWG